MCAPVILHSFTTHILPIQSYTFICIKNSMAQLNKKQKKRMKEAAAKAKGKNKFYHMKKAKAAPTTALMFNSTQKKKLGKLLHYM